MFLAECSLRGKLEYTLKGTLGSLEIDLDEKKIFLSFNKCFVIYNIQPNNIFHNYFLQYYNCYYHTHNKTTIELEILNMIK